ncbi:MAG: DinB family protein [Acidobacteriaceae bacterium]
MSSPALSGEDLLAWNDDTAQKWKQLATDRPDLLQVPCDIYRQSTVGHLLQHIVAAQLRYADRLSGAPVTDYANIPFGSAQEIFAAHDRALNVFRRLIADPSYDWDEQIDFQTQTAGRLRAKRKSFLHHALLHSIRHYSQLTTLARQRGFGPPPMDYLLMACTRVD